MSAETQKLTRLDFESNHFESTVRHCFGDRITQKALRLKQSNEFKDKLIRNFSSVDTIANNLASKMTTDRELRGQFSQYLKDGPGTLKNPCEELQAFMESAERVPPFIDRKLVEEGGKVFRTKLDIPGLMLYGFPISIYNQAFIPSITLAILYSNQPTNNPLTILEALAQKRAKQRGAVRLLETFKWFGKVSMPGAGDVYTEPFAESCNIRIVHAHIRRAIKNHKDSWNFSPTLSWKEAEIGAPLCAADGSIVVSSVVAALYSMRYHLKKHISRQDLNSLNHWANYVSYLQGVPEELLCPTVDDTVAHFAAFMMSTNINTYHREVASFVESLQNLHMERALFRKSKPLQIAINGLTQAIISEIFSKEIREHYHIKEAPNWSKLMLVATKLGFSSINIASKKSEYLNKIIENKTNYLWNGLIPEAEKTFGKYYGSVVT